MKKLKIIGIIVLLYLFIHISYTTVAQEGAIFITIFSSQENNLDISAQVTVATNQHTFPAHYDGVGTFYLFLPGFAESKKLAFETSQNIHLQSS